MGEFVSPEYQQRLDELATSLTTDRIPPKTYEQLTLEGQLHDRVEDGTMTIQEATACLEDFTAEYGDDFIRNRFEQVD
jgi:hypothetical protein